MQLMLVFVTVLGAQVLGLALAAAVLRGLLALMGVGSRLATSRAMLTQEQLPSIEASSGLACPESTFRAAVRTPTLQATRY